jgi:hypothetical protein
LLDFDLKMPQNVQHGMLVIRRAQLEALNRPFLDAFKARVAEDLRRRYPEMGEKGIGALIEEGIAKGRRYDIQSEAAVAGLIELMAEHGAEFETGPGWEWAAEVLADPTRPGDARLSRLKSRLEFHGQGR